MYSRVRLRVCVQAFASLCGNRAAMATEWKPLPYMVEAGSQRAAAPAAALAQLSSALARGGVGG